MILLGHEYGHSKLVHLWYTLKVKKHNGALFILMLSEGAEKMLVYLNRTRDRLAQSAFVTASEEACPRPPVGPTAAYRFLLHAHAHIAHSPS